MINDNQGSCSVEETKRVSFTEKFNYLPEEERALLGLNFGESQQFKEVVRCTSPSVSECAVCQKRYCDKHNKVVVCPHCKKLACKTCFAKAPDYEWLPMGLLESCRACSDDYAEVTKAKYEAACANARRVKTYPLTYNGDLPIDEKDTLQQRSVGFSTRDSALHCLRVGAAYLGYDIVLDIRYETRRGNRFSQTTWWATGVYAKRLVRDWSAASDRAPRDDEHRKPKRQSRKS